MSNLSTETEHPYHQLLRRYTLWDLVCYKCQGEWTSTQITTLHARCPYCDAEGMVGSAAMQLIALEKDKAP